MVKKDEKSNIGWQLCYTYTTKSIFIWWK